MRSGRSARGAIQEPQCTGPELELVQHVLGVGERPVDQEQCSAGERPGCIAGDELKATVWCLSQFAETGPQ